MGLDPLKKLFERRFGVPVLEVHPLQGELGGSGRRIIRLAGGEHSAIGILYGVHEENIAFLEFSRHFRRRGLPVPEIYDEDLAHGAYLEEDLGDTTLFEFLSRTVLERRLLRTSSRPTARSWRYCPAFRWRPDAT